MKKKLIILCLGLISVLSFSAFITDDDPFLELLKKLEEFAKKQPQEKVHLHLDKPYYAIGDNIWFKAYVTNSRTSAPSAISNILYVELINDRDSITKQLKLPMQSGITWGDFKITDSLKEGNYRIRAYTQWMRNAGPDFFFDKMIKIGNGWTNKVFTKTNYEYSEANNEERVKTTIQFLNPSASPFSNAEVSYQIILGTKKTSLAKAVTNAKGEISINVVNTSSNALKSGRIIATISLPDGTKVIKAIPIKSTSSTTNVQFFPEGGNLVESLPCKVAFKAVGSNGLGENISGTVIDNEGVEVLTFETMYLGMGSFVLNPMPGKSYNAKIKFSNGTEKTIALPKTQASGYILAVNNIDSAKMSIKVMLSQDQLNKGDLSLVAQHNGLVLFSTKVPTAKQIASVPVPKTAFPSGIIQLTLFNTQNMPVCERLTFVNNINDKIDIAIENLKANYTKKGSVDFALVATNATKPLQGSFSLSVTNLMVTPDLDNESNILTSLLLTSDLVGYVEKPNHYFLNNSIETRIELDHLLLTQGWRKISWTAVNSGQFPVITYPAEKGMKISGMVTNNGKPVVKGKISLMSSSKGFFATDTVTDANGRFIFDQISFSDSTRFALKAVTNTDHKGVKIIMDEVPGQIVTTNKNSGDIEIDINESIKDYLKQSAAYFNDQEAKGFLNRVTQLNAVEIVGKANKAAASSSNLNGPGTADYVFNADDMKNAQTLSHFLTGRLSGMRVENGYVKSTRNDGLVTVIVDGVTYIDGQGGDAVAATATSIDDLTLLDIESIEILKSIANTTIYGHAGQNGVIIITTKAGKEKTTFNTRAPGMLPYSPKGFYTVRQFYSPKYDANPDTKPDLRTTVFWEPNLVTDVNGKATVKYYNTDKDGPYRVVIEGIDANGSLARKVFNYNVK
jgi:TonB-dependent SusC/RagA subfamily outer membrane receptor